MVCAMIHLPYIHLQSATDFSVAYRITRVHMREVEKEEELLYVATAGHKRWKEQDICVGPTTECRINEI